MLINLYEYEKTGKKTFDNIREYCLTEKVSEDYLRSSICKTGLRGKQARILSGMAAFIILLLVQIFFGKAGSFFADMIPYQKIDPYNCFARVSIHHAVQMIVAIIVIIVLSRLLKIDFYFKLGHTGKGIKCLALFTGAFAVISFVVHILMLAFDQLPTYDFPLDLRNILGTLGFQLFLSGPSEEIIYRALTISILIYAFGKSITIKGSITLEVILASLLFAFAHVNWSLNPFVFEVDYFNVFYAFVLGIIQGIVYQKSRSILYPMLMHSFSNVLMVGVGYMFAA